jgi:hypothetical protein
MKSPKFLRRVSNGRACQQDTKVPRYSGKFLEETSPSDSLVGELHQQ